MSETEPWKRVTLRIPQSMIDDLDSVVETGAFPNRSEAIRARIREGKRVVIPQLPESIRNDVEIPTPIGVGSLQPNADGDLQRCPACGSKPGDVSWQTAPGQQICVNDACPVNSWGGVNYDV